MCLLSAKTMQPSLPGENSRPGELRRGEPAGPGEGSPEDGRGRSEGDLLLGKLERRQDRATQEWLGFSKGYQAQRKSKGHVFTVGRCLGQRVQTEVGVEA